MRRGGFLVCLIVSGLLAAGCGDGTTPTPEPDRVVTRVAEELAVAATLTAVAPKASARPPAVQEAATTELLPTSTPTRVGAPAIVPAATPTRVTPARVVPPPSRPPLVQIVPVDGSDGNKSLGNDRGVNDGRNILLPGFQLAEVSKPMVFRDRVVFQVEVFDRNVGLKDGAGIESVTFLIRDETGNTVHSRTESTPGYCSFGGGEPSCNVWWFSKHNNTWPDGAPLRPGVHDVEILIQPAQSQAVTWFWSFKIEL